MPIVVAVCTNTMKGLAIAHRFFYGISERSTTVVGKLIPLLLCVPCFKAHNFLFKIAYSLNQRRLRFLCGEDFSLSSITAEYRAEASLMSFKPFAMSSMTLKELRPA